jgi:hypothetical protein
LTGFFSGSGVDSAGAAGVWVRLVRPESMPMSGFFSSTKDLGVNISRGLTVVVVDAESGPNRDGYISSGVESNDSAGESSILTLGEDVWAAQ